MRTHTHTYTVFVILPSQCGVSAIFNDDEQVELFALGVDGQIFHKQMTLQKTWTDWMGLGGNFSVGAQTVRNGEGRVEIFAIGKDDQLYHNWQDSTGGGFQVRTFVCMYVYVCVCMCMYVWVWVVIDYCISFEG